MHGGGAGGAFTNQLPYTGGSGGGGGWILFAYKNKTGISITNMFTANGGSGGTGGSAVGGGSTVDGTGGNGADSGNIYIWDLTNQNYTITTGTSGSINSGKTGGAGGICLASL